MRECDAKTVNAYHSANVYLIRSDVGRTLIESAYRRQEFVDGSP